MTVAEMIDKLREISPELLVVRASHSTLIETKPWLGTVEVVSADEGQIVKGVHYRIREPWDRDKPSKMVVLVD